LQGWGGSRKYPFTAAANTDAVRKTGGTQDAGGYEAAKQTREFEAGRAKQDTALPVLFVSHAI